MMDCLRILIIIIGFPIVFAPWITYLMPRIIEEVVKIGAIIGLSQDESAISYILIFMVWVVVMPSGTEVRKARRKREEENEIPRMRKKDVP